MGYDELAVLIEDTKSEEFYGSWTYLDEEILMEDIWRKEKD